MYKKSKYSRRQIKTILLVGEGYDEQAFLNYLKSELVSRDSGAEIKIKNAKGKGAAHVIDWTIKQAAIAEYDQIGVLFDTDTDWSQSVEKKAKKQKLTLLKSEPCFEAMLLRIISITPEEETKKLKKQFAQYVNDKPTVSESYSIRFNPSVLFAEQEKEPTIKLLLSLLKAQ